MTKIEQRPFGQTADGIQVDCFRLTGSGGLTAEILTYGGTIRALWVPVDGHSRDVVLGFDSLADYEAQDKYIGMNIGRVANRIGQGRFSLDGHVYQAEVNSPPHCLHGGSQGLHQKVWAAEVSEDQLTLTTHSPDGECGFPGCLEVQVIYRVSDDNSLVLEYFASTDQPTPVSLTNHSYFNLNGHSHGSIEDHLVQIRACHFLEAGSDVLPTGVRLPVEGTPFDLRKPHPLRPGLESNHPQITAAQGYDHNYILKSKPDGVLLHAASAKADGVHMDCFTTQPGLQLYTGNFLAGEQGKDGAVYPPRSGFCLETQNWPDAVNHPDFPAAILRPGERYHQITAYHFYRANS